MAEYYVQRATAGLLITEGSQVSEQGIGYINTPGIHSPAQVQGWRQVTAAVHEKKGHVFIQLWHCGRISHPDFHGGNLPVAPSAINPNDRSYTPGGFKETVTPQALSVDEIHAVTRDFQKAAVNAMLETVYRQWKAAIGASAEDLRRFKVTDLSEIPEKENARYRSLIGTLINLKPVLSVNELNFLKSVGHTN